MEGPLKANERPETQRDKFPNEHHWRILPMKNN